MDCKDNEIGLTKDHFWFRARIELLRVLLEKPGGGKKQKILNLGAGTGDDLPVISQFGDVYIIDIDPKALECIPDDLIVEKKVCNASGISYPDNYFDIIIATHVLEHIEYDALVIKEIHRVLKPKGHFIFTAPALNFLYSSHDRALGHVRRYDKKTIRKLLSSFKCIEIGYWIFTLFLLFMIQRIFRRKKSDSEIQYMKIPKMINGFFYFLLSFENWLIKHRITLPLGANIYGVYQK